MTKNDLLEFKQMVARDQGIIILSTFSEVYKGQLAERMEFLSDKDLQIVYPQLLCFCADTGGVILSTMLKIKTITVLLHEEEHNE